MLLIIQMCNIISDCVCPLFQEKATMMHGRGYDPNNGYEDYISLVPTEGVILV